MVKQSTLIKRVRAHDIICQRQSETETNQYQKQSEGLACPWPGHLASGSSASTRGRL